MIRNLFLYTTILALVSASCTKGTSGNEEEQYSENVHLEKPNKIHTLKDDQTPIGRLDEVYVLDENRLLIVEGTPAVRIFDNYEMTRTIGRNGQGPCEYESISAVALRGDSISVLNPTQNKITTYNIENGECLGEINSPSLQTEFYLYRDSISYLTGNMSYTVVTPDTASIFQRVYEDGSVERLDYRLNDLDAVRTVISMRSPALDFSEWGNELFTYFPLTEKIVALNLDNNLVRSFPIEIDIKRDEFNTAGNNVNEVLEIIRGDFQYVRWIHAEEDWVAVQYAQRAEDGGNPDFGLLFYSPEGAFLGQVKTKYQVVGYGRGKFIELRTEGLQDDYTFGLAFREVTFD